MISQQYVKKSLGRINILRFMLKRNGIGTHTDHGLISAFLKVSNTFAVNGSCIINYVVYLYRVYGVLDSLSSYILNYELLIQGMVKWILYSI